MYVKVTFELRDGRELTCEYGYSYEPATRWEPGFCDVSDPVYKLDGVEVEPEDLPKGLDVIATAMYEHGDCDSRFTYKEQPPEEPDYEPDSDY